MSEFEHDAGQMSRRDFLGKAGRLAGAAVVVSLTGLETACGTTGTPIESLKPTKESERKVYGSMQMYNALRKDLSVNQQQAALLTQVGLNKNTIQIPENDYRYLQTTVGASGDEASVLTIAAEIDNTGVSFVGHMFQDAQTKLGNDKAQAANVASIASFTNKTIDETVQEYASVKSSHSDREDIAPLLTTIGLMGGDLTQADSMLQQIHNAGINDKRDDASVLYASLFTTANMGDITNALQKLVNEKIGPNVRGDLLMATILSNYDMQSVLEMYDFAGKLEDMTQEAAARLVLDTVATELLTLQNTQGQTATQSARPIVTHPGGVGYYNSYFFYNHTSGVNSGFSSGRGGSSSSGGVSGRGGISTGGGGTGSGSGGSGTG